MMQDSMQQRYLTVKLHNLERASFANVLRLARYLGVNTTACTELNRTYLHRAVLARLSAA